MATQTQNVIREVDAKDVKDFARATVKAVKDEIKEEVELPFQYPYSN